MSIVEKLSRRAWLRKTALFTAAVGASSMLGPSTSLAQGKASKSVVHYRDYPNNGQMYGMCKFFRGHGMMGGGMMGRGMMAGECQVVKGPISPMGWCDLYAPRGG